MNIEQLAIEAGVIYVDESSTYWTDNNAIEVLDKFAQAVIKEWLKENGNDLRDVVACMIDTDVKKLMEENDND